MSAQWDYLISLYHCGVRGIAPPEPPEDLDWEAFAALADRQAVTPVVFSALRKLDCVPAQLRLSMHMTSLELSLQNRVRQEAALDVLQKLNAAGIPAAVLKGMSVARYFAAPETRICADTDILIAPEKEQDAMELFGRLGFSVEPREKYPHHFSATHPAVGIVEVHVRLWNDESALAFGGWDYTLNAAAFLPEATLYGKPFFVLPPTDALQYLFLHLMKHFIKQAEGVRRAYDIALFFAENRDSIDTERFWNNLQQWNLDEYFNTVLSVFLRAGCFREDDFPGMTLQSESVCELLSADMEQYDREASLPPRAGEAWQRYRGVRAKIQGGTAQEDYRHYRRRERMLVLLPSRTLMAQRYPALEKCALLYPVFWVHRAATGIFSKRCGDVLRHLHPGRKSFFSSKAEAGSRGALMQELGLFRE